MLMNGLTSELQTVRTEAAKLETPPHEPNLFLSERDAENQHPTIAPNQLPYRVLQAPVGKKGFNMSTREAGGMPHMHAI